MNIGERQSLKVNRLMPQGAYLIDDEGEEVLLPGKYLSDDIKEGDTLEVFIYNDSEDRVIATTETPLIMVGQIAPLKVVDTNKFGAYCDMGLEKDLLIPFRNQRRRLERGETAVVFLYLDEETDRLVGSCKLDEFIVKEGSEFLEVGQEVEALVYAETDIGYKAVVDQYYDGLLYKSECPQHLRKGDKVRAFVKPMREDGKLDLSINAIGHKSIEPNADKILTLLKEHNGFLPFHDKSSPEAIRDKFDMSKKLFKKAIGSLYKAHQITIEQDGIRIAKKK